MIEAMNIFQRLTRRSLVMIAVVVFVVLAVSTFALRGRQSAAKPAGAHGQNFDDR